MLLKIIGFIVVLVIALVVVIILQPSDFSYSSSAKMAAPADKIFAQVNDFHKWENWSPWAKLDPNAKNTFEGPLLGKHAVFRWEGNSQVGAGNMTITESHPHDRILLRLEFLKPMPGINVTEFTFKPDGNQTLVTWTMTGKANFMAKAVGLIMNCKKMVEGMFDQGLANMKAIVEQKPAS